MSAAQDSHQAVASLLQQQSAQSPSPNSHGAVDSLTCQWAHCGERCSSPEALYKANDAQEHVCERHVGRKSTNNLNLQCQWGTCRTTTVKRDHITSHIRVHVPLKPHKCDQCGKSFKRPQDLKKHVKTHADDSVLLRSPDPNSAAAAAAAAAARGPGANNGFQQNASKGFYPDPSGQGHSQAPPYGYHPGVAQHYGGAMHGQGAQHGNYGPVYYPNPQSVGYADGNQLTESRKRGHDALNDFFSMIKRRDIDPAQYMDLGSRIGGLQSMPIPMAMGGYQNPYGHGGMEADYGGTAAMYHPAQVPQFQYTLPFAELKTKNDLLSIDSFLEQLQHTVYEQPAPQQAVNNAIDPRFQNPTGRESDSPPHLPSLSASSHTGSTTDEAASTPGLTPGSFSHSPRSAHSSSVAPSSRTSGGLYPHLPSVSAMTDGQNNGYGSQTSAPPSGLGNNFEEFDGRRRFSGNYLQRARQSPQDKESPASENSTERDAKSPKSAEGAKLPGIHNLTRRDSEGSTDQRESQWLDNMRIIETLRTYLSTRLQKGQFEGGEGEMDMADEDRESTPRPGPREGEADGDGDVKMGMTEREREAGSLYPVLKAVEGN